MTRNNLPNHRAKASTALINRKEEARLQYVLLAERVEENAGQRRASSIAVGDGGPVPGDPAAPGLPGRQDQRPAHRLSLPCQGG